MCGDAPDINIGAIVNRLRSASVQRVDVFEKKLIQNAGASTVIRDLLAEGAAALMFAAAGFQVEMSDRPDLVLECFGQSIGAEVKHFRLKQQDENDEVLLAGPGDYLVKYGDTIPLEGKTAWDQVIEVAVNKAVKLKRNDPNLLVILSSSTNCIDDLVLMTAADVLNEEPARRACPELSRLNGLLLLSPEFNLASQRDVHFFDLSLSNVALLPEVRAAIEGIREWVV